MSALLTVFADMVVSAKAGDFLGTSVPNINEHVSKYDIQTQLLKEIDTLMPNSHGANTASSRLTQNEEVLKPIYVALPKNEHGKLDHVAANYALHRLFVSRHGWVVKGLGPTGGKYNVSSPAGILKNQVPSYIEDLFDRRLGGKGFELHDLAVLAATIEHLIQDEGAHRLRTAFDIHDTHRTGLLSSSAATEMLDTYMAAHILSKDITELNRSAARQIRSQIPEIFHHWGETQNFVHEVYNNTVKTMPHSASQLDFMDLSRVAEAVGEQFGSFFHNNVCMQMKDKLMKLEYRKSGRVKLSDFYKRAVDESSEGFWQFQESATYLKEIGALENNTQDEPSVMIANYMTAPSNCIAYSGFYSICCKNECEDLLGSLERLLGASEAKPAFIAALVAFTPSSSSRPPGALPTTLRQRLEEIAAQHSGMVPLHSRLFAQWLHHVYPRECPFPHLSGTTSSKLPEEWLEDASVHASREEMLLYTQWSSNDTLWTGSATTDNKRKFHEALTWSSEEELFITQPLREELQVSLPLGEELQSSLKPSPLKPAPTASTVLFTIAVSLALGFNRRLMQPAKTAQIGPRGEPEKFFV